MQILLLDKIKFTRLSKHDVLWPVAGEENIFNAC